MTGPVPPTPAKARGLWELIAEPRTVTLLTCLVYVMLCAAGVVAMVEPPSRIASELGGGITDLWGGLLFIGGLLGAIGALPGWWYVERAGTSGCLAALGMYGAAIVHLSDSSPGARAVQILMTLALAMMLINRWLRIAGATLDPARGTPTATAVLNDRRPGQP